MRQVQSHRPPTGAAPGPTDSTATVGPRPLAIDADISSLIHLSGEGKAASTQGGYSGMPPLSMLVLAGSLRGAGRPRPKHRRKSFSLTREKIQAYGSGDLPVLCWPHGCCC